MRVVLDVNVLVSAAITPTPGQVGRAILDQAGVSYTLLLSDFMVWKFAGVLHYPRIRTRYPHLTEDAVQAYVGEVARTAEVIREQTVLTEADGGSRDEEDNRVLAVAVDGNADCVVTRNTNHFPETFRGVRVISPEAFLDLLRQERESAPEEGSPPETPGLR